MNLWNFDRVWSPGCAHCCQSYNPGFKSFWSLGVVVWYEFPDRGRGENGRSGGHRLGKRPNKTKTFAEMQNKQKLVKTVWENSGNDKSCFWTRCFDEFLRGNLNLPSFCVLAEFLASESLSQSEVSNRSAPGVLHNKNQPILIKNNEFPTQIIKRTNYLTNLCQSNWKKENSRKTGDFCKCWTANMTSGQCVRLVWQLSTSRSLLHSKSSSSL